MIINDLQRLRWQILDEALRDTETEYFMGERTSTNETGRTRSLIYYVNQRLKTFKKSYKCSKRMLQNDVAFFQSKGARLEPRFRRGHKRILRYINVKWRNPLLAPAATIAAEQASPVVGVALPVDSPLTPVSLRVFGEEARIVEALGTPEVLQRQSDVKSGTVTLQVGLPICDALFALLMGLGTDIEVLAPATLRDRIKQTVLGMQKLYKKESTTPKQEVQGDLFGGLF
ncbi:MAG: WYL domain-containing protein [Bacteroidaceae bacterium]|nr:WYL domain-containing protein [Bacteroidaceae bacterium]